MNKRGWYVLFLDEFFNTAGILGPYPTQHYAEQAVEILQEAEKMLLREVDMGSENLCVPVLYHYTRVIDLSPEELAVISTRS